MKSIQSQLSLGLLLSLIIIFFGQWLLVNHAVRVLAERYISERLMHDAEGLLNAINFDPEGNYSLNDTSIDPIFSRPFSGHYFRITANKQVTRSRSLWDQDIAVPDLTSTDAIIEFVAGPQQKTLLLWAKQFHKQGHAIHIAIAEDFTPIEADLRKFQRGYALASFIALILLIGIQVIIIRKGFRPLNQTRTELEQLTQGEITTIDEDVPSEIRPLVKELNYLLANLRARLQRSRNALGNLTHAMKTPLTHLQQISQREELNSHPDIKERLYTQTLLLQQLIERELTRARLAGHSMPGKRLDVETEINTLIDSLAHIYHHKSISFESQIELKQGTTMDREDFLELMGNLLDNACKWARQKIKLTITDENGFLILVEDDGPGIAESELDKLTQRGQRLDESITGHGLGLAIVQDIVDSYEGKIIFDRSPDLDGLRLQVTLAC